MWEKKVLIYPCIFLIPCIGNVFCIVFHHHKFSLFDFLIILTTWDVPNTLWDVSGPRNCREIRNFSQLFPPLYGKVLGVHVWQEVFFFHQRVEEEVRSVLLYALYPSASLSLSVSFSLLLTVYSLRVSPIFFLSSLNSLSLSLTLCWLHFLSHSLFYVGKCL